MKTVICTGYDPPEVLVLEEMNKPVTGDQEILVRIMLTTVNSLNGIFTIYFWAGSTVRLTRKITRRSFKSFIVI